jgi:DNA polymerase III epsilon subunit-like protein
LGGAAFLLFDVMLRGAYVRKIMPSNITVIFDTETSGLSPQQGYRIIENGTYC